MVSVWSDVAQMTPPIFFVLDRSVLEAVAWFCGTCLIFSTEHLLYTYHNTLFFQVFNHKRQNAWVVGNTRLVVLYKCSIAKGCGTRMSSFYCFSICGQKLKGIAKKVALWHVSKRGFW